MTPADTEKLAVALGWMKCERLGKEVWYDPTGGHVVPAELAAALEADLDKLIADVRAHPQLRIDDAAALAKLGVPRPSSPSP